MASEVALAREELLFVATQASQGQDFTNFVVGNQIYPISAFEVRQEMRTFPNDEKRNSRVRLRPVEDRYGVATWSVSCYAKGASTATAEPEISPLVRTTIGAGVQATATVINATGTRTTATMTVTRNAYKNYAGQAILIKKGTSLGTYYESTWIVSATTSPVANKAKIRVSPTLGTAPATGTVVVGSWTYRQATTSPSAIAFLSYKGHTGWRVTGGAGNTMVVKAPGEGPATIDFSGEAMRVVKTGTDTLAAGIAASTTTNCTLSGSAQRFEKGSFILITKSGSTTKEVVYVNSDVATTATTTLGSLLRGRKGTTATAWTTSATVTLSPWYPGCLGTSAVASQGRPIAGFKGVVQLDGTNVVVRDITATYTANTVMNTGEKNNEMYVTTFSHPGMADVSGQFTAYFRKADAKYFSDARHVRERELHIPIGLESTGANVIVIQNRQIAIKTPALDTSDQVEATVDWDGFGASTSDNDAYRIAWIN